MKITINKKYLVFPVNSLLSQKRLTFSVGNREVYGLDIKLEPCRDKVDFYAYIEMTRFQGQTLEMRVEPELDIPFREADEIDLPDLYKEELRPQVRFSTKNGWINDPNGLVYLDGVYHMFYQYNPADYKWGNMHWGHAVSTDLIHWEEKDIALYPDENGTIFSGCALIDTENRLGLQQGEQKTAVLYYTTTSPFSQRMAVSTDGFQTIRKYQEEAVIPWIVEENRDPKVIFCPELNCYVLALYLDADDFSLFRSTDLVNWERFFDFKIPGDIEFPDILPLRDQYGNKKYVITSCHDFYLVGRFEKDTFVIEQGVRQMQWGTTTQAGQSISNLPDGRCVRMIWQKWNDLTAPFCGQMALPLEYSLENADGVYYLSVCLAKEVRTLYKNTDTYTNVSAPFTAKLEDASYLLKLKGPKYKEGKLSVTVFGRTVQLDFAKNLLTYTPLTQCPICVAGDSLDLTLVIDRTGADIYLDGGKVYTTAINTGTVQDRYVPFLNIESDTEYSLDELEITSLHTIW